MRPSADGGKLLGLELLRFLAAFAVLVWHYQHFAFNGAAIDVVRAAQPFHTVLRLFYEYGWYGVQIFWSISGFIFFWRYRASVADRSVTGPVFFVLRFSRLYPLHLITLLAVALLQWAYFARTQHYFVYPHNDGGHFLLQLFMASHWGLQQGYSFNGPIWSISVEVLVYLLFFAGLRLLGKSAWINLGAVALCVALKASGMANPVSDCVGFFYAGGLAAIAYSGAARSCWRQNAALGVTLLAPLLLALAGTPSDNTVYFFLLAYLPVALFWLAQPLVLKPPLARAVEAAGNMTYSSYLLHFPLQLAIALYFAHQGAPVPMYGAMLFLFFIGVTGLSAWVAYRYLELPAQRALRRLLIRPAPSARPDPPRC
jgi:peptidoglycan/LPS O-acetylase OafA/YrhL